MDEVQCLATPPLTLGECPLWHPGIGRLLFVDILGHTIYVQSHDMLRFQPILLEGPVGFIVPCGSQGIVAGVEDALVKIDVLTGRREPLACLSLSANLRFNDGKCNPRGHLWAGVMIMADETRKLGSGALWHIHQGSTAEALPAMTIPNGMAWSADGSLFYHTDTVTGQIDAYDVLSDGGIANRRLAVDLRGEAGAPDGFCIDGEGMLWVAMWGGFQVVQCDPGTGEVLSRLPIPSRHVSCCTFGGHDLHTLYISTAADGDAPGCLFACQVPVSGTLPNEYRL